MAFNLTRAAGALASSFHAKATTATLRRQLINVAARVTRSARRATLRLPAAWPWAAAWQQLFTAAIGPPARSLNPPTAARPDRRHQWKRRADRRPAAPSQPQPSMKINYARPPDCAVHPGLAIFLEPTPCDRQARSPDKPNPTSPSSQ